jgi:hypothetical protein
VEYQVVYADDVYELEKQVNGFLNEGWEPLGAPTIVRYIGQDDEAAYHDFYQALIRHVPQAEPEKTEQYDCPGWRIICPDGKARGNPYHNKGDAEFDASHGDKCMPGCPGGVHTVEPVMFRHTGRPQADTDKGEAR